MVTMCDVCAWRLPSRLFHKQKHSFNTQCNCDFNDPVLSLSPYLVNSLHSGIIKVTRTQRVALPYCNDTSD